MTRFSTSAELKSITTLIHSPETKQQAVNVVTVLTMGFPPGLVKLEQQFSVIMSRLIESTLKPLLYCWKRVLFVYMHVVD